MGRFVNPLPEFRNETGVAFAKGSIEFLVVSTGTTQIAIFSDEEEDTTLDNPVLLDARGVPPAVFYTGTCGIVIRDSNGRQVDRADDVQSVDSFSPEFLTDTGVADVYVVTPSPAITANAEGKTFAVRIINANNGPSTIAFSGLDPVAIVKNEDSPLILGDLVGGVLYDFTFNGTSYIVVPSLSSTTQNRNLIFDGNFDTVGWYEGESFAAMATFQRIVGNWRYTKGGTMVHTATRATDAPSVAQVGFLGTTSLRIDCTTADTDIILTDASDVFTRIEGYDFAQIAQSPFTISFFHKHTKTGIYCVAFQNSVPDRSLVHEYTQVSSDVWEFHSFVVPASPSAGTWDYTNGVGLILAFTLAAGTNFHASAADVWETGNFIATANQVNACDNVANNFGLDFILVERGSIASKYPIETIAETLERESRYYHNTFPIGTVPAQSAGVAGAIRAAGTTTNGRTTINYQWPKEMRAAPTITQYNPSAANASARNVTDSTDTALSVLSTTEKTISLEGVDATDGGDSMAIHLRADARL